MGLFSKLFKNKQESSGEDSGFYVPGEAQSPTRKRAANTAGGGGSRRGGKEAPDPVLPEKNAHAAASSGLSPWPWAWPSACRCCSIPNRRRPITDCP